MNLSNTRLNFRNTRKGINRSAAQWLTRLQEYVAEWETTTTRLWHEERVFDINPFNEYLQRYMTGTRLRIVQHPEPEEIPGPATWDTYPSYDTSASRQYAVIHLLLIQSIFMVHIISYLFTRI